MKLTIRNSPNQNPRHGGPVRLVICHTPEGADAGTDATIMNPAEEVSYHRLYLKGGQEAIQYVPFHRNAWHALSLNSVSDGLACSGFAHQFDLHTAEAREFAKGVAERLKARKLPCKWTTDVATGGFCRHGDLQSNRSDPTPDMNEWREFCKLVDAAYHLKPNTYWEWLAWNLGEGDHKNDGKANPATRPAGLPRRVPASWWARRALYLARRS